MRVKRDPRRAQFAPKSAKVLSDLEATVHRSQVPSHLNLSITRPQQLSPLLLGLFFLSENFMYEY